MSYDAFVARLHTLAGPDVAKQLAAEFAGHRIYFSKLPPQSISICPALAAQIFADFNGANHGELAFSYGVPMDVVYQVIKCLMENRGAAVSKTQATPQECPLNHPQDALALVVRHPLMPCVHGLYLSLSSERMVELYEEIPCRMTTPGQGDESPTPAP